MDAQRHGHDYKCRYEEDDTSEEGKRYRGRNFLNALKVAYGSKIEYEKHKCSREIREALYCYSGGRSVTVEKQVDHCGGCESKCRCDNDTTYDGRHYGEPFGSHYPEAAAEPVVVAYYRLG